MLRITGHPDYRHTGHAVINGNADAYQQALKRLERQEAQEKMEVDLNNLKRDVDTLHAKMDEMMKLLRGG